MLLVGIDWADKEHVYCLMDEARTTLSTGIVEHTADGLERFMAAIRAHAQAAHDVLVAVETRHGPLVGASTRDSPSMPSTPKRWNAIETDSGSPAPNPTYEMPGCWPRSCGPIARCFRLLPWSRSWGR